MPLSPNQYKCPICRNNLSFKEIRCPVCRNYFWRIPHIIIAAILILTTVIAAVITIDHFAVNRVPVESQQSNVNLPQQRRERTVEIQKPRK